MSQISLADAEYASKRRKTRRERLLAEMKLVVSWKALLAAIALYCPGAGRGSRADALSSMLPVHLMQNRFELSGSAMEETLYEIASFKQFANWISSEAILDETTILNIRHRLEVNNLADDIFEAFNAHLKRRGLLLTRGSIATPPSLPRRVRPRTRRRARP